MASNSSRSSSRASKSIMTGGFTEWAKKDKVKVIRTTPSGDRKVLIFNYEKAAKGREINDFYLEPNDIILVP